MIEPDLVRKEGRVPSSIRVMPWFDLAVATDGKIAPCCEFDGSLGTTALGDRLHDAVERLRRVLPAFRR